MGKLQGKVAFVSGGSQGIGEQTALLFAREGASVAVIASSEFAKAENVAKRIRDAGGQASAHVADVRDAKRVAKAVSEVVAAHGPIDILVNSAGVFPPTPAADTDEDVYDKVMDINVKGTWNTICAIAPSMRARKTDGSSIFHPSWARWRSPTMPSIVRARRRSIC
jgi:3-oxoacyl-[acyl-carrier protein] reductase